MDLSTTNAPQVRDVIRCAFTGDFAAWLAEPSGSVALTTYQADKVFLIGSDGRQVMLLPRNFHRPKGLDVVGRRLIPGIRHQIRVLINVPELALAFQPNQLGCCDAPFLAGGGRAGGAWIVFDRIPSDEIPGKRRRCWPDRAEHIFWHR
jgi:hypothetical protein